jgi:DNA-binding response OmpR family regulator
MIDRRKKVLIADNDEEVLIALERAMETEGYDTAVALSHGEIFRMLTAGSFDLLVLDDYLSDRDCAEVLTECHQTRKMPLVIVTYQHFPSHADREKALSLGASAWVSKHAHSELTGIARYLLSPNAGYRGEFESMT